MALYYYNKYTVVTTKEFPIIETRFVGIYVSAYENLYPGYTTNPNAETVHQYLVPVGTPIRLIDVPEGQDLSYSVANGRYIIQDNRVLKLIEYDGCSKDVGSIYEGRGFAVEVTEFSTQPIIDYSRGSLVQSNIVAEYGTYPKNGKHTDGYWYVIGARVNNAPTTPGPFTSPAYGTILQSGQTVTIQWGASTDPDGDSITYETQESYDSGSTWTNTTARSGTSYTFTVPSDPTKTKVRFRVRAKDSYGGYSSDQTSADFTINAAPTISSVMVDGAAAVNGGERMISHNNNIPISFVPNDPDASDTLQYQIKLGSIVKVDYTNCTKGATVNYTLPNADLQTGANVLTINVKDSKGAVTTFTYNIKNKGPANYSLKTVYDVIVTFINTRKV